MPQEPSIEELFLAEATETLHLMNTTLLELEQDPASADHYLGTLQRSAHTLKGAAAAAGFSVVRTFVHNFESCVKALESGEIGAHGAAFEALFAFLDGIEATVHEACGSPVPVQLRLDAIVAQLRGVFGERVDLDPAEYARKGLVQGGGKSAELATVRVSVEKLDRQMATVEELVQLKSDGHRQADQMRDLVERLEDLGEISRRVLSLIQKSQGGVPANGSILELARSQAAFVEDSIQFSQTVHDGARRHTHLLDRVGGRLQDDIRSLRLVPARLAFASFPRVVRDVSHQQGKQACFVLEGGETEVDRDLLDAIKDPVVHLLNNAVDHGIEAPFEREAAGKAPQARITVTVESRAGGLLLRAADDGRGIDVAAVRRRAEQHEAIGPDGAAQLTDADLMALVFRQGFSTSRQVTEVSGRGVGLDVVRSRVEDLGGSVAVESQAGVGTIFILRLPLSLTTMRMLLVRVRGAVFALPATTVDRVTRLEREQVMRVDWGEACEIDGQPVPVRALEAALHCEGSALRGAARRPAVVVRSASQQLVLLVDSIDGEQELVIKPLPRQLRGLAKIAGAAVLADGRILPALNVSDMLREFEGGLFLHSAFSDARETESRRHRILIVDDSITTRTLEKSVLEAVGYEVEVANDGVDALSRLERGRFDLVLSDVQMPRMDGIELVTRVKSSEAHRQMPVVLVSSLASDDDRKRGLSAGADAYLAKAEFRQELLLETLERLL